MNGGVVYSTEHGRMCPLCGRPISECGCHGKPLSPRGDGVVRVARETKGRKGKGVTVITGAPLDTAALKDLAKQLKARCGAGGTVKSDTIEIQGDHREAVIELLQARGWKVKRVGS